MKEKTSQRDAEIIEIADGYQSAVVTAPAVFPSGDEKFVPALAMADKMSLGVVGICV